MGKPVRLLRPIDDPPSSGVLTQQEIAFLRRGGFGMETRSSVGENPYVKTQAKYEALVRSSLTLDQAAARLVVAPGEVLQWVTVQPRRLYGIQTGSTWVFPEFQFDGPRLLSGFQEVVAHLDPELHPLAVSNWFHMPNPDLPEDDREERNLSPREWLRSGRPSAPVAALAADL
jgi:hypothetical protein